MSGRQKTSNEEVNWRESQSSDGIKYAVDDSVAGSPINNDGLVFLEEHTNVFAICGAKFGELGRTASGGFGIDGEFSWKFTISIGGNLRQRGV